MYPVYREFYTDSGLRFEPGESDLAGLTPDEIADAQHNGWVGEAGEVAQGAPVAEAAESEPVALTHYEGEGEPPPGTWEHHWQQEAATTAESAEDAAPRKRGRKE